MWAYFPVQQWPHKIVLTRVRDCTYQGRINVVCKCPSVRCTTRTKYRYPLNGRVSLTYVVGCFVVETELQSVAGRLMML